MANNRFLGSLGRWRRTVVLSVKSLLLHPMRSGLTVLGILIGVTSVVWLLAIGEGISQASQEQIAALGANNIIVRTLKPASDKFDGGGYGITRADFVKLTSTLPTLEAAVPIREMVCEFRVGRRALEGRLVGCTPEYQETGRLSIAAGRFLSDSDSLTERNHCVISSEVAATLFPLGNAVGELVQADHEFYTIVGVCKPRSASAGIGGSAGGRRLLEGRLHTAANHVAPFGRPDRPDSAGSVPSRLDSRCRRSPFASPNRKAYFQPRTS